MKKKLLIAFLCAALAGSMTVQAETSSQPASQETETSETETSEMETSETETSETETSGSENSGQEAPNPPSMSASPKTPMWRASLRPSASNRSLLLFTRHRPVRNIS